MTRQLVLETSALLLYPGGLFLIMLGGVAEVVARGLVAPRGASWKVVLSDLSVGPWPWPHRRGLPTLALAAILMEALSATQLAAPFNPISPSDRNVLVAGAALICVGGTFMVLGWARSFAPDRLSLFVQAAWLVAVLAPALLTGDLRPQVLGSFQVHAAIPLKILAALTYLSCLPFLLRLVNQAESSGRTPSREEAAFAAVRIMLWLPYCGLFVSVFLPTPADDLRGILAFYGAGPTVAGAGILLARRLQLLQPDQIVAYCRWVIAPLTLATLGVAIILSHL